MLNKLVLVTGVLALSAMASAKSYSVTLFQPSVVAGAELKPGDYKVDLKDSKAVITNGKQKVEAEVKVESAPEKFGATSVKYQNGDGKYRIQEIRLGGTNTKLVFN